MKKAVSALALISLYLLVSLAPLALLLTSSEPVRRPFLVELSVALGFVGLSMMGLQFALVARLKPVAAPFGIDVVYRFHREISFVALLFVLAHPILLLLQDAPRYMPLLMLPTAPWRARFAVASLVLLLTLIGLSLWRRLLRIPYELWQFTHGLLAVAVVGLALAHIHGVGYYTSGIVRQVLFDLTAGSLVGLLVWARIVVPLARVRQPWRVVHVEPERSRSTTLVMEPEGHSGFSFMPGQFCWISRWPVAIAQHPFSFSSPGDPQQGGRVAVTVKALGDWTRRVGSAELGRRVYLDGPHGEFSIDLYQAPGYVFIAAGVGITPAFSMISTMYQRDDVRPVILFYVNRDWESIIFREQLEELEFQMSNLEIVHVLRRAPADWRGETGRLTARLLHRHLPRQYRRFEFFLCGSEALMDAAEEALATIEVPLERVHSERFAMV